MKVQRSCILDPRPQRCSLSRLHLHDCGPGHGAADGHAIAHGSPSAATIIFVQKNSKIPEEHQRQVQAQEAPEDERQQQPRQAQQQRQRAAAAAAAEQGAQLAWGRVRCLFFQTYRKVKVKKCFEICNNYLFAFTFAMEV